ncbi:hypothetical protein [Candidatus Pantoea multigeneris]|uniref:Uncharacterized protein n=1 Tax=Candidatus Pantoea multigeneris TaxID=2608357 RepID=A0ABX0RJY2_9GAMM|nr:hypothetical protein [Pantoea multigeneris]NIF23919.1 hypothetical protein [Pantoea multigeneris]
MEGTCRDYYESAEDTDITRDRALQELKAHHFVSEEDIAAFYADLGEREFYRAQDVLRWLGY